MAHKWKKVGLALRLDPNLLDQIEAKKNEVEENLSDTLKEWLKKSYNTESYGDPSWKLLVDAVAHPFGGKDRALALQIAAKYNGKCVCLYCEGVPIPSCNLHGCHQEAIIGYPIQSWNAVEPSLGIREF